MHHRPTPPKISTTFIWFARGALVALVALAMSCSEDSAQGSGARDAGTDLRSPGDPRRDVDSEADLGSDTDVDADADTGADVEIGRYAPDCTPTGQTIPPEQYREGELPEPLGETPRIIWTRALDCAEQELIRGASEAAYGYARFRVDGEETGAIAVLPGFHRISGGWLPSLGLFSPETGETLRCREYDDSMSQASSPLYLLPQDDLVVFGTESALGEVPPDIDPDDYDYVGAAASSPATGEPAWFWDVEPEEAFASGGALLHPAGQLVVKTDRTHLVSLDALTGEVAWARTAASITRDSAARFGWFMGATSDAVVVSASRNVQEPRLFEIDECGYASELPALYESPADPGMPSSHRNRIWPHTVPAHIGEYALVRSEEATHIFDASWNEVHREENCWVAATLSESEFICTQPDRDSDSLDLLTYDVQTEARATHTVEPPQDVLGEQSYFNFNGELVAGANRTVIATGSYKGDDERWRSRIFIIPLDAPGRASHIDIIEPEDSSSLWIQQPLLTPDGKLIIPASGKLYTIQTAVPGLAPGPYPRGLKFGGNQNRGFVEVP